MSPNGLLAGSVVLAALAALAAGCGPECGNNRLDEGEQCDGSPNCRADCTLTVCGDGVAEVLEECDDGAMNSDVTPDACRTNCRLPGCPDGVVDTGEECDSSCECDFDCRITGVCGDGFHSVCELCDDGAANSDTAPDACRTDCTPARCGDGVTDTGEECDDGQMNSDVIADRCRRTGCVLPSCGDFVIDTGEECDGGPSCTATCTNV